MPRPDVAHLLILGGTTEAVHLAESAVGRFGTALRITFSLAGATRRPRTVPGRVRVGGYGGATGLADWLRREKVDMLVDATHPYATQISSNAREACAARSVPRMVFARPAWQPKPGDRWRTVSDLDTAAALLPDMTERAFLSVGSLRLSAFAGLQDVHLVVRMIDPPVEPLPLANCSIVLGRGPFDVDAERALLQRERIGAVVSRNSGGAATYAKIEAARDLNLPVVMVAPPPQVPGEKLESMEGVLQWIDSQVASPPPAKP